MWSALVWSLWICVTVRQVSCQGHFENVAFNKSCTLSSYHEGYKYPTDGRFAVNNNTDGILDPTNYINCIHTKYGDMNSHWTVNLERPYPVYSITVWARERYQSRMAHCKITVDGKLCYQFPDNIKDLQRKMNVNCTDGVVSGSVIRLEKDVRGKGLSDGETTINMCEFQVWSCSARYWDSGCDQECGECRDGAMCDKVTGHCDSGCDRPGIQPPLCTQECQDATFGVDCKDTCSSNCGGVCDKVSGHCTCKPGWTGKTCLTECDGGYYGQDCEEECGACKGGVPCHHVNGSCQQCECNYNMPLCKDYDNDVNTTVMVIGSVSAVLGVAVVALLVALILLRARLARILQDLQDNSAVQPLEMEMDARMPRISDTYEIVPLAEQAAAVEVDLSNYDRMEIYENKKDITNVYTELRVKKQ